MREIKDCSRDEVIALLKDAAINWLAHDGLWFRAVEDKFGIEEAIDLDKKAWQRFTVLEARRIMDRLRLEERGGIPALVQGLKFRLYAHINAQETTEVSATRCVFTMRSCRVQEARRRQGLSDFPCKEVGIIEYSGFARTIDARIQTKCLICPPDSHPEDLFCSWEFNLGE